MAIENGYTCHQGFSLHVAAVAVTLIFVVFLLIIRRTINLGQAKWLGVVGSITYHLYLLHHNIGYVILQRLAGHVNRYLLLASLLGLFLGLAWLLHLMVERRYSKVLSQQLQRWLARY